MERKEWGVRESDRERCWALARHVARRARQHPAVREARRFFLGSDYATVTPERAGELLHSPATHVLGPREFREHGIPWADHKVTDGSRTLGHDDDAQWEDWRLRVEWPQGTRDMTTRVTWQHGSGAREWVWLPPRPDETMAVKPKDREWPIETPWPVERAATARYPVHARTWLQSLVRRARTVAEVFRWSEAEAMVYILADKHPAIEPVAYSIERGEDEKLPPLIVLRAQLFVTRETVAAAYAGAQACVRGVRHFGSRPGPPLESRALRLFDFVAGRRDECIAKALRPEGWAGMLRAWNKLYPDWKYRNAHSMEKAYALTRDRLLGEGEAARLERVGATIKMGDEAEAHRQALLGRIGKARARTVSR